MQCTCEAGQLPASHIKTERGRDGMKRIKILVLLLLVAFIASSTYGCIFGNNDAEPTSTGLTTAKDDPAAGSTPNYDNIPKNSNGTYDLPINKYTAQVPILESDITNVILSEYGTSLFFAPISEEEFNAHVQKIKNNGFTENPQELPLEYTAQRADDGFFVKFEVTPQFTKLTVYSDARHFDKK